MLEEHPFEGFIEAVPAFTTLTVFYDPLLTTLLAAEHRLRTLMNVIDTERVSTPATVIEIPVWYGVEAGPDLGIVAAHAGMSDEEVIAIHSSIDYLVYMIGFAPGFPYLGGLDERIACPRKATPRAAIPAGSVGIAGIQTGIYPIETPGGWQIIGQTPLQLFDVNGHPPARIQAGNRLRFVEITEEEFHFLKGDEDGN